MAMDDPVSLYHTRVFVRVQVTCSKQTTVAMNHVRLCTNGKNHNDMYKHATRTGSTFVPTVPVKPFHTALASFGFCGVEGLI